MGKKRRKKRQEGEGVKRNYVFQAKCRSEKMLRDLKLHMILKEVEEGTCSAIET
jgi:hypothetical protein